MSAQANAPSHNPPVAAAHQPPPGPSRAHVPDMFNGIARRYDFINRVLSMGMDVGWRKVLIQNLQAHGGQHVLDVATGTGDVAFALTHDERIANVTGVDVSSGMLAIAQQKATALPPRIPVEFSLGDATALAFEHSFDAVTISFGIRNVVDVPKALGSMRRALRPGGRLLVLEFADPQASILSGPMRWYRRHVLPRVGGLLSGDNAAYTYLDETIATFPTRDAFEALLQQAGFATTKRIELSFGNVILYIADNGEQPEQP